MIFDPKYINGDVLASLSAKKGTFEELLSRFDNSSNWALQSALLSVIRNLERKGLLKENSKGVLSVTPNGKKLINKLGYND